MHAHQEPINKSVQLPQKPSTLLYHVHVIHCMIPKYDIMWVHSAILRNRAR